MEDKNLEDASEHTIVGPSPTQKSHKRVFVGVAGVVGVLLIGGFIGYRLLSTPSSSNNSPKANAAPIAAVKTADAQVSISSVGFMPTALRLKAGSTVTLTNNDTKNHTLTSAQLEDFDSGVLMPSDSYSFTFEAQGTYQISADDPATTSMTVTVVE